MFSGSKTLFGCVLKFLVLASFFLSFVTGDADAQKTAKRMKSKNPYLITNIFSSAEEISPSVSRQKSINKANRIAFMVLLKNLKMDENFLANISDEEIAEAVYSRQILDERMAGNYYSAKFNISFLKSSVNAILDVGEAQEVVRGEEEIFLIFPVEVMKGQTVLWERNNGWNKSLDESINFSNARNIILPAGDYADIVSVNLKNVSSSNYSTFNSTLTRYGADSAIVAYFEFDDIENKANITLNIIRQSGTSKIRLSFVNSKNLSRSGLLLEVADRAVSHVINSNEVATKKVDKSNSDTMAINVEISDLEEWMSIKKKLESLYFIKNLQLESISRNTVKVVIKHSTTEADMAGLLAKYDFMLRNDRRGQYFLSAK